MTYWMRILLPTGLGVFAFILHSWTLNQKLKPQRFVIVMEDIAAGELISENKLGSIDMSGDLARLPKVAIPYHERAVLYQHPAPRKLEAGDVVFWADATIRLQPKLNPGEKQFPVSMAGWSVVPEMILPDQYVTFVIGQEDVYRSSNLEESSEPVPDPMPSTPPIIGPFRVLAVGNRVDPAAAADPSSRTDRVLTVAIQFDPQTGRPDTKSQLLLDVAAGGRGLTFRGIMQEQPPKDAAAVNVASRR